MNYFFYSTLTQKHLEATVSYHHTSHPFEPKQAIKALIFLQKKHQIRPKYGYVFLLVQTNITCFVVT